MADTIVTTESMRSLAQKLDNLANEYTNIYTGELYGTCVDDIKKAWIGADADAVVNQLEGFHNDFNNIVKVVNQYADYLRKAAQTYDDAQETLKNTASTLTKDV